MRFSFKYDKRKVLQALRFHFIWQSEIRILLIVIVLFDIISAVMYYFGKIRPEPFLLGSAIWLFFIISFWYILPYTIYRKSTTFKESFNISIQSDYIMLENAQGYVEWKWTDFLKYAETPGFFHLYFTSKSFFLLPKDEMSDAFIDQFRTLLKAKISNTVKR